MEVQYRLLMCPMCVCETGPVLLGVCVCVCIEPEHGPSVTEDTVNVVIFVFK